jgi:cation diffusion facilitator CzcD-associated flavoprotein CzcO
MSQSSTRNHRVIIIGAGPGGMCTAIKLQEAGIRDFVILEKASGVGGTWWHNRYPGAECDVKSHLYSFSFEIKRDWSRPFAGQPEILEYLEHVARKYGVLPFVQFNTEVTAAHWRDESGEWEVVTQDGLIHRAPILVSGMGMFNELAWPDVQGLADFKGKVFHSARWDRDYDLTGKRVAVIGSAASAVQFIPEIAARTGRLHVFQRTANWVAPKDDKPYTAEQIAHFRQDPHAIHEARARVYREIEDFMLFNNAKLQDDLTALALKNIEVVRDPALRAKLTPKYPFGCKRPLFSNLYYPVFNLPHVELVTDRIERITAGGIVTADGTTREIDTLILATGFEVSRYLSAIEVSGRQGRTLADAWNDGAQAYLGVMTSGFPNLFMLYGPNTNNGSILEMIEIQVGYIVRQIERIEAERLALIDVRAEAENHYNAAIQEDIRKVEVWQAACGHYYNARSGRMVTQWPHTISEFRRRLAEPNPTAYEVIAG